jgi:hypothetical protein
VQHEGRGCDGVVVKLPRDGGTESAHAADGDYEGLARRRDPARSRRATSADYGEFLAA